jgi:hypothetical protein
MIVLRRRKVADLFWVSDVSSGVLRSKTKRKYSEKLCFCTVLDTLWVQKLSHLDLKALNDDVLEPRENVSKKISLI